MNEGICFCAIGTDVGIFTRIFQWRMQAQITETFEELKDVLNVSVSLAQCAINDEPRSTSTEIFAITVKAAEAKHMLARNCMYCEIAAVMMAKVA